MKKRIIYVILTLLIIIVTNYLSIKITEWICSKRIDVDYQSLDLKIDDSYIRYYTVYKENFFGKYKVYKINNHYDNSGINMVKDQLEKSPIWSREKFNEYVMQRFYEIIDGEIYEIDREDLYFYHRDYSDIYAICDVKNAKLYYYKFDFLNTPSLDSTVLGIRTRGYLSREVYDVRGGLQFDGTDYYVFEFNEEKGREIVNALRNSSIWSKEKLNDSILDCFRYNQEVMTLENAYYHYKKVCRTSDKYKKEHFTDEEATGYEVGVYDCDNNIFYY